jgi:hypothetical protein
MPEVPPQADTALDTFMSNFVAKITATPTAYGVTAADATAIGALASDFSARLATSSDPATRTKVAVAQKNTSKLALVAKARQLIKVITAYPPLTAAQRAELGLNPRDVAPTPIPAPATRPLLAVEPDGTLRLVDESMPDHRRKPAGVSGALVFTKVAPATDAPPTTPDDARFALLATRARAALPLPAGSNGKTLWVLAQWYNERGELGPVSAAASTTIAA